MKETYWWSHIHLYIKIVETVGIIAISSHLPPYAMRRESELMLFVGSRDQLQIKAETKMNCLDNTVLYGWWEFSVTIQSEVPVVSLHDEMQKDHCVMNDWGK